MKLKLSTKALAHGSGRSFWVAVGIWVLVAAVISTMLLLGAGCIGPTETRDDTFDVGESPTLVVRSENGSVKVNAGSDGTIRVQATLRNAPRVQYQVQQDGDTIRVDAQVTGVFGNAEADITVTVPTNTGVDLQTSNGSIEVRGIDGFGHLRTSNGRIVLEEVKGSFDARTSNGAISFVGEMTAGGENRLETSNGRVTVELQGTPSVELDASTSNGQVTCKLPILASVTETTHLVGTIGNGEAELIIRTSNGSVTIE